MNVKDFLFSSLEQVMVTIDPEYVAKTEEIFMKYGGKQVLKKNVSHWFIPLGFALKIDDEEPNKVTLCYLVNSTYHQDLFKDLVSEDIAGNSRHNPVYSRPYSLKGRIVSWYNFKKSVIESRLRR